MTKSLLFRPEPYDGESIRGFLGRVVEANFLGNSIWIKDVLAETDRIRKMTGIALFGKAPVWLETAWGIKEGQPGTNHSYMLGNGARCCPECLSERPYWPVEWEHMLYTVCHRHRRSMYSRCPHCMSRLIWDRPELLRCHICEAAICEWPRLTIARDEEVNLCSHLARSIANNFSRSIFFPQNDLDSVLLPISLHELVRLITFLGAYCESITVKQSGQHKAAEIDEAHTLVRTAASVLVNWPLKFNAFLREIGGYNDLDAHRKEPSHAFNNFVRVIRNRFNTSALRFVFDAYRSFVIENWRGVLNHRQKWIDDDELNAQRYISAAVACSALGISRRRLKQLIEENVLRGYITKTPQQREFIVVERSSLVDAEPVLNDRITLRVAAKLLGLPKGRVCELVVGELLPEIIYRPHPDTIRLFSRREIASFVKRLSASRREPSEGEDLIAAVVLLKTHLSSDEEFRSFIQAILAGEISHVSTRPTTQGFKALMFARSEFYAWRSALRANINDIRVTVVEASIQLGVKQEVAYHLVRTGLLTSLVTFLGKKKCAMVRLADIEAFNAAYISAAHLASVENTSPKAMVKNLRMRGVCPVVGPDIDRCRQYFFRRNDIDGFSGVPGVFWPAPPILRSV